MSIIFFRFFLLFSVVANRAGPKTRYHRACSRSLTSLVLSRSLLRYCTKLCLLGFSAISASFSRNFSGLWTWLAYGLGWGAVLWISTVSATFFWIFFGFWVDFGSCFKSFMDYSSTRACLLCYQPMAIVHYANLVLLNKYTFLTEVGTRAPGTGGAPVLSCRRIAKQFRYC